MVVSGLRLVFRMFFVLFVSFALTSLLDVMIILYVVLAMPKALNTGG